MFFLWQTFQYIITSVIDDKRTNRAGHASYATDIERRRQSRVRMDYLPLSQRLISSVVSKIDFQSHWFDLLLLQSPLECRFNALTGYSGQGMCAKSGSEKQTMRRRSFRLVRFFNSRGICIDDSFAIESNVRSFRRLFLYLHARARARWQFLLSLPC